MTEKERDSFALDTSRIELTVELRICFYDCLDPIEWIKHPSFISAFMSHKKADKTVFNLLLEIFKTEEDKQDWIEYAKSSEACCDELLVELFFLTFSLDIYNSIGDKKTITRALYKDDKRTLEYLRFCMKEERFGDLGVIIDSISTWKLVDAIKQMNDDERIMLLCGLPENKTIELVSNKLLEDCGLKSRLMSTEKGRQIILTDLYERKTSDSSEWNEYLSLLDEEGQKSFVFDTERISPTAELRICLYKYTRLVEWLKHPSVVSLIGNKDNDTGVSVKQFLDDFQNEEDKNKWLKYVLDCPITTDVLKTELFYLTENLDIYKAIENKSFVIKHMNEAGINEFKLFLKFCYRNLDDEGFNGVVDKLVEDRLVLALKEMDSDDGIQFVSRLPEDKALGIVTKDEFKGSQLFVTYMGEKWESLKGELPYCVFDLESDGENIKEFAFCAENNMRPYTGEDQINSLIRKLKKSSIIVGHNIKLWDLPILYRKGLKLPGNTFVWDTLEIEILLNPCRYAYSLHTEHNAEADTKLTNELFWNQLYRLSTDEQLVKQLRDVLPDNIEKIIDKLHADYFSEFLRSTAYLERQFFQELRPLDDELVEQLKGIALIPESEETLLIAPSNLWARLAQYIPLSFPGALACDSFRSIDFST